MLQVQSFCLISGVSLHPVIFLVCTSGLSSCQSGLLSSDQKQTQNRQIVTTLMLSSWGYVWGLKNIFLHISVGITSLFKSNNEKQLKGSFERGIETPSEISTSFPHKQLLNLTFLDPRLSALGCRKA